MPWFRIDDNLHEHPKPRRAGVGKDMQGLAAIGLWTMGGSYASDNVTDGFVPEHTLTRWAPSMAAGRRLAQRLVDAELWTPDEVNGEPGWRFHQWDERNPDARSVNLRREAESEGGQRGNHTRWHVNRKVHDPQCPFCIGSPESGTRSGQDRGTRFPGESSRPSPVPTPTVVNPSSRLSSVPSGLTDDDLTRIEQATGGDRRHAEKVAADVLSRSAKPAERPLAYVLRAIGDEPERYKPTRPGVRKGEVCAVRGHTDKAVGCKQCASERLGGDR